MKRKHGGFTLIEVLLNLGIIAIFITITAQLFVLLSSSRDQGKAMGEVNQQGVQIMQLLTYSVRNASSITLPAVGANGSSLSITTSDPLKNPTIVTLDNNNITFSEGGRPAFNVNSDKVSVDSLTFSNFTMPGTNGNMKIEFTLSDISTDYSYSKDFIGGAIIR